MMQNLFYRNKHVRIISLNARSIFLFKNNRDLSQFSSLARQIYLNTSTFAISAYEDPTQQPYSYLMLDL